MCSAGSEVVTVGYTSAKLHAIQRPGYSLGQGGLLHIITYDVVIGTHLGEEQKSLIKQLCIVPAEAKAFPLSVLSFLMGIKCNHSGVINHAFRLNHELFFYSWDVL
jgi:hypothetical protein